MNVLIEIDFSSSFIISLIFLKELLHAIFAEHKIVLIEFLNLGAFVANGVALDFDSDKLETCGMSVWLRDRDRYLQLTSTGLSARWRNDFQDAPFLAPFLLRGEFSERTGMIDTRYFLSGADEFAA